MTEIKETFAQRLKRLRKAKGNPTQDAVAAKVGTSRSHITKMETGGDMPGREILEALATYYGVTMDYLQTGKNAPASQFADDPDYEADKLRWDEVFHNLPPPQRKFAIGQFEGFLAPRIDKPKRARRGH